MTQPVLEQVYRMLPPALRSIAVSVYGYRLRHWRYGPETEELVAEALSRDYWSPARWDDWQKETLASVLHLAATKVPYYRNRWQMRRQNGDSSSWEYIENWPVLDKQSVREHSKAFVADGCAMAKLYHDRTSGTTGTPLTLWYSRKALRAWNALFEARARRWHEVSRQENWATLGAKQVVPADVRKPPFWVWNRPMRQLYLSATHVSRENVKAFMDALRSYKITHMVVYPSLASLLAAEALDLGVETPKLTLVISVAEPLTPQRRELLATAFRCNIRETYGMGEIVAAASECDAGNLHIWPEVGFVETFEDDQEIANDNGSSGRLICTSLLNTAMPLVRYAVGDRGAQEKNSLIACRCGRLLPLLKSIGGRTCELLIACDGRRVYLSLSPIVSDLPVKESQIIQESLSLLKMRYVAAQGFKKEMETLFADRLKDRMGNVNVVCEAVDEIPRERNGKFRAVVSNVR